MQLFMYRWKDTNPNTVTYNQWDSWKPCSEDKAKEIREYIEMGYAYQIATFNQVNIEGYEV